MDTNVSLDHNLTNLLNTSLTTEDGRSSSGHPCDIKWQQYLRLVFVPLFLMIGLFGNSISFLVMGSKTYREKSYSYYLRALAIFDTLNLIIVLIRELNSASHELGWLEKGFLFNHTNLSCKITEFLWHVIFVTSSWLVVCFTLDRFVAVCYPLYRPRLCTEKVAKLSIALVIVCICWTQCYHFVYIEHLDRKQNPHEPCMVSLENGPEKRMEYLAIEYIFFNLVLLFGLPFLIMTICNGSIICHIKHMQKIRMTEETRNSKKAHLAIYTLYAVCIMFTITVLPCTILSLIFYIEKLVLKSEKSFCYLVQFNAPFQMIRLINYSCNFVLYGLTGRRFRRECWNLFGCNVRVPSCGCCGRKKEESIRMKSPYLPQRITNNNNGIYKPVSKEDK